MARSILDAINAAAAELQNATMDSRNGAAQTTTRSEAVRPKVSPSGVKSKTKPTAKPKAEPKAPSMAEAIAAAAAELGGQTKGSASKPKGQTAACGTKAGAKDTPKTKGGAKYVIPAAFKEAIENYLKSRADLKERLTAKGKSLDGCCDYIFDVMRKRAESNRKGASAVGLYADPQEIFGLAVHYYDESEEDLKAELNGKKEG